MLSKLILVLALVGCTFAKLDLNREASVHVENSNSGLDATPVSHAGAVVINGTSQLNGLTMPCNNKFCEMLKYTASCKSLNLGMKKVCAIHLLGYRYGCDAFPAPKEVLNAPSICIPAAQRILTPLSTNPAAALSAILTPYLNPADFEADNCDRQCFQNFQYATHDFFSTCRPQLSAKVAIASLMSAFQEYRNQACSKNPAGNNCYTSVMRLVSPASSRTAASASFAIDDNAELTPEGELTKILNDGNAMDLSVLRESVAALDALNGAMLEAVESISPHFESAVLMERSAEDTQEIEQAHTGDTVSDARRSLQAPAPDLFEFTCAYTPSGIPAALVLAGTCAGLTNLGCCAATGVTMVQQNPVSSIAALAAGGSANPTIFPPCLYRYIEDACPAVDLTNYCTNGSIASTSVIRGTFFANLTSGAGGLPNVYTKTGTLTIQTVIQRVLVALAPPLAAWPYLFTNPLQIQIVDYTYFSDSAGTVALTPSNGLAYTTPGGDYTAALSGQFTYQIVNQDLDATSAAAITAVLNNGFFYGGLSQTFTSLVGGLDSSKVTPRAPFPVPSAQIFEPVPLVIKKNK